VAGEACIFEVLFYALVVVLAKKVGVNEKRYIPKK
jgi:hypothetical protein